MGSLWNRSGTIERYADDLAAAGAMAYFFIGGTTTPLSVYENVGQSAVHSHPVVADSRGRWPDVFVPYIAGYDVRVTTAAGVQLTFSQSIPNYDPVELTVTPIPEQAFSTGQIMGEFADGEKAGWVRLNGKTIGSGASSATERRDDDTENLFTKLWNALPNAMAPVLPSRGASAAADWGAAKQLTLPDARGKGFVGMDTMGNTAAGAFAGLTFAAGSPTAVGSKVGNTNTTLALANLPAHNHTGTVGSSGAHSHPGHTNTDGLHNHITLCDNTGTGDNNNYVKGGTGWSSTVEVRSDSSEHSHTFTTDSSGAHDHSLTINNAGSGTAFVAMDPALLVTWYIKL